MACGEMFGILAAQLRYVAEQVKEVEVKLLAWHRADETSRRLQSVPGLGPITASAIVRDRRRSEASFKSGRQFRGLARPRAAATVERRQRTLGGHQQARRRVYPAVAGARCSCDRWLAEAAGYAQNAMDRAAIGTPAHQCCNGGLRPTSLRASPGRFMMHGNRYNSCSGFCYHSVIERCTQTRAD